MFENTKEVIRSVNRGRTDKYKGQKFEDTKVVTRNRKPRKDREHNGQQFEDTKGVIRSRKSKDTQYNTMANSLKIPKL